MRETLQRGDDDLESLNCIIYAQKVGDFFLIVAWSRPEQAWSMEGLSGLKGYVLNH